jgi:hypothetical protein
MARRLLLAAVSGRVVGRRARDGLRSSEDGALSPGAAAAAEARAAHWGRRVVTVQLSQVQAHVAPTDVDVNAGVQWLDEALFAEARAAAASGAGPAGASLGGKAWLILLAMSSPRISTPIHIDASISRGTGCKPGDTLDTRKWLPLSWQILLATRHFSAPVWRIRWHPMTWRAKCVTPY